MLTLQLMVVGPSHTVRRRFGTPYPLRSDISLLVNLLSKLWKHIFFRGTTDNFMVLKEMIDLWALCLCSVAKSILTWWYLDFFFFLWKDVINVCLICTCVRVAVWRRSCHRSFMFNSFIFGRCDWVSGQRDVQMIWYYWMHFFLWWYTLEIVEFCLV